jgi:hypothetical protein
MGARFDPMNGSSRDNRGIPGMSILGMSILGMNIWELTERAFPGAHFL